MATFLLLLYDNQEDRDSWHSLSPEEIQKGIEQYVNWSKRPFVVASQRLAEDAGRIIRVRNGAPKVTDGPFSETKEVLGGYYAIDASDYDEAVRLSLDHPHLQHGTIEIRAIHGEASDSTAT